MLNYSICTIFRLMLLVYEEKNKNKDKIKFDETIMNNLFFNILANIDFSLINCKEVFKEQITILQKYDDVYDVNNNFFDIYGFMGFDIETEIIIIKTKYVELKNELTNNNKSSTNYFSIFLNSILNWHRLKPEQQHTLTIKIIDSICEILSNTELKNIYDEYYLDWYINYQHIKQSVKNKNKEKLKLIDKVYKNIFIVPKLRPVRDVKKIETEFKNKLDQYKFNQKETKTQEELEKIYIEMNKPKYENEELKYMDFTSKINTHKNQISSPNINYNYMNWLTEIIDKYNLNNVNPVMLTNYFYHKQIINDPSGKKYNPCYDLNSDYQSILSEYVDFANFGEDYSYELKNDFVKNFDLNEFKNWINDELNVKNLSECENEYKTMVENRKQQTDQFYNKWEQKLNHFTEKVYEFSPLIYYPELDYSLTFDNDEFKKNI